jgi:enoyl-[acyl-carrier protein] reductase II
MLWSTPVTRLLGIDVPIVQGGMAWCSDAYLAAAVSNGGGLGLIAAGNAPADWVRSQVVLARELTSRPFGINIMLLSPHAAAVAAVAAEEKVSCVFTGAGLPSAYMPMWKQVGIKVIPVVPSVAIAKLMQRGGADAVVCEGCEAGGHIGELTTMTLVPQVVEAVNIPVIAAGGIADGRGMAASFMLGACGVQMGTRFLCAEECTVHENYKQKVIDAGDTATIVTGRSTGHPVRTIKNRMAREFQRLEGEGASPQELEALGTGALAKAVRGDVNHGSVMAGQSAGMVHRIEPAAEIIRQTCEQARALLGGAQEWL